MSKVSHFEGWGTARAARAGGTDLWLTRTTSVSRSLRSQGGGLRRLGPLKKPSRVRSLSGPKGKPEAVSTAPTWSQRVNDERERGDARKDRVGQDAQARHLHVRRRLADLWVCGQPEVSLAHRSLAQDQPAQRTQVNESRSLTLRRTAQSGVMTAVSCFSRLTDEYSSGSSDDSGVKTSFQRNHSCTPA